MKIADVTEGTPATVIIYTDTQAAVVVRRTPKRVVVALVETDAATREPVEPGTPDPGYRIQGILDKIIPGTERTYTLKEDSKGNAFGRNGEGQRVSLGHSVEYRTPNW